MMPVTGGEIFSVLQFIAKVLEDAVPAAYGKADFERLVDETKSLETTFKRALQIDSGDLQKLLEEDKIAEDLEAIKQQLQAKEWCPVAQNDPEMNVLRVNRSATREEAFHRTLVECVEHVADTQVADVWKMAGGAVAWTVKTVVLIPLVPLAFLSGVGEGAWRSSGYNSHKRNISESIKGIKIRLLSIDQKLKGTLQLSTEEDT